MAAPCMSVWVNEWMRGHCKTLWKCRNIQSIYQMWFSVIGYPWHFELHQWPVMVPAALEDQWGCRAPCPSEQITSRIGIGGDVTNLTYWPLILTVLISSFARVNKSDCHVARPITGLAKPSITMQLVLSWRNNRMNYRFLCQLFSWTLSYSIHEPICILCSVAS